MYVHTEHHNFSYSKRILWGYDRVSAVQRNHLIHSRCVCVCVACSGISFFKYPQPRGSGTSVQCSARDSALTSPELGSAILCVSEKLKMLVFSNLRSELIDLLPVLKIIIDRSIRTPKSRLKMYKCNCIRNIVRFFFF